MNSIVNLLSNVFSNSKFFDLFKGKEKLKNELLQNLASQFYDLNKEQIKLNTQDSKSQFSFVASWRPTIGYVCALALLYQYVLRDLLTWIILIIDNKIPLPPALDVTQIISILLAMLGMSGLRTYEKTK
jgi:hypothetical protein